MNERELLSELKSLNKQDYYWTVLWELVMGEIYAQGFGLITGPIKHIDIDKAKQDRLGRRLVLLEESIAKQKVRIGKEAMKIMEEAEERGIPEKERYDAITNKKYRGNRPTLDTLKIYLANSMPIAKAKALLREAAETESKDWHRDDRAEREMQILKRYEKRLKEMRVVIPQRRIQKNPNHFRQ